MTPQPYSSEHIEALQETVNIAMGRAGASLANVLGVFVRLSVPRIQILDALHSGPAAAALIGEDACISAVRQSFHSVLQGEALVIYGEQGCHELADLLGYDGTIEPSGEQELLLDVSNILVGACLCGIMEQLECGPDVSFSAPSLLAERSSMQALLRPEALTWSHALMVEVNFSLEQRDFTCHLLIMMPEHSIDKMRALLDQALAAL